MLTQVVSTYIASYQTVSIIDAIDWSWREQNAIIVNITIFKACSEWKNEILIYFTFRQAVWSRTIVNSIFTRHMIRAVHNETFIACKRVINSAFSVISVYNPIG